MKTADSKIFKAGIFKAGILVLVLFNFTTSQANTLFEGWFEIYLGAKKIGYLTERYEFTPDSKFKSTYYLKTVGENGNITESLKAFASSNLSPINYAYTSKVAEEIKVIDATFKGEVMTLKINDGKTVKKETKKIKKGTFLSTFLLYLIMQDKSGGLKLNNNYMYNAIAEEEGTAYTGQALVSSKEKIKGKDSFKILNKFKTGTKAEEKFFTWITPKGEILLTRSPDKNIDVRIAEDQAAATKGMTVNQQDLKLLFNGKIPGDNSAKDSSEITTTKSKEKDKGSPSPSGSPGASPGASSEKSSPAETPKFKEKKSKADDAPLSETVSDDEADKLEIKKKPKGK